MLSSFDWARIAGWKPLAEVRERLAVAEAVIRLEENVRRLDEGVGVWG
ncbi:hypothetical protein [Geobacter benzoatilyticus]|uniref:Uncharacterized protein n=1 Tax=Geobacter benzoatilyticus TaxID=2815309 RepID=A0ABX7Q709_9BACT|nr:hypothetical protein [Geobacter benzoatilyticus]QSV47149.1 hypothetical protein JZM60_07790 [Geobacter benzoatilyticus]